MHQSLEKEATDSGVWMLLEGFLEEADLETNPEAEQN